MNGNMHQTYEWSCGADEQMFCQLGCHLIQTNVKFCVIDCDTLAHYNPGKTREWMYTEQHSLTIYIWDMQNFDGLFILSHKHKIIPQKFTDAFLNAISILSENIEFFDQEMVRSGNDRMLMQKIE